ncbi:hypothetical protein ABW21_db0208750 [Orbilia brochopaga]|nr:hypothetical protein ABW21_db0208750 [Drechslerella brochopaga]
MVSTRSSKEASPIYPSQEPDIPIESPGSSQSQSPTEITSASGRKGRRSNRLTSPRSPSSGGDSPKSDSSAREKMSRTKIEESTEGAPSQIEKPSQNPDDEMIGVQVGEVSPGAKGRKRVHDEIASKDPKTPAEEPEDRPPSRQANGEPLGKKLRETPSPPREIDENCMFAPIPVEIEYAAFMATHGVQPPQKEEAPSSSNSDSSHETSDDDQKERMPHALANSSRKRSHDDSVDDDSSNNDRHDESTPATSPTREASPTTEYKTSVREQKLTDEKSTATLEPSVEQKQPNSPASENAASPPKEEIKLSGGFSNTSAVSPFGSLATKATETTAPDGTSNGDSLFAASKFSSFSKVTSAFGVSPAPLGPSPFAAAPTGSDNVFSKMSSNTTPSVFASSSGPNVFAVMSSNTSGSGFSGVSTSAFGSGTSIFGTASSKPLPKAQPLEGIKALEKSDAGDDQDSESVDGAEGASTDGPGEAHQNGKSTVILPPKPALKSGEEEYDMIFQARAKLFEFSSNSWKERGIGNVRVITPKAEEYQESDDGQAPKKTPVARIVMRQEGVGRLILNANIFKDMLSDPGKQASENTIRFLAVNSVTFAEAHDEKKDDQIKDVEGNETSKKEATLDEGEGKTKTDEAQPAITHKPALRTYLLRFKSSDLVAAFRDNVTDNCPI